MLVGVLICSSPVVDMEEADTAMLQILLLDWEFPMTNFFTNMRHRGVMGHGFTLD
jgi:hypothetical protein